MPDMPGRSSRRSGEPSDHEGFSSYLTKSLREMKILRDHGRFMTPLLATGGAHAASGVATQSREPL
jgi:hypothetical protein